MKKLLTVLLVIAVMFTFSFGSAFGAISGYDKNLGTAHFNKAMEEVKKAGEIDLDGYKVDYKTVKNHEADILSAVLDYEKNGTATDYVGNGDAGMTIEQFLELTVTTGTGADTVTTYLNKDLVMALVSEQYAADKEEAIAILNGLSLADYSTEKLDEVDADGCTTYVEHVQFLINEAIKGINKAEFDSDSTVAKYIEAKTGGSSPAADAEYIDKYFEAYKGEPELGAIEYTKLVKEKGYMAGSQPTGLGVYELNTAFVLKAATATEPAVTLNDYTTAAVNANDTTSAADIALAKANIASAYATYLSTAKDPDKTLLANVKMMLDFLAEEKVVELTAPYNTYFVNADKARVNAALSNVETFKAQAAQLAAETDANGTLVRDAEDVADLVTEGTIHEYLTALGIAIPEITKDGKTVDKYRTTKDCVEAIEKLYASLEDAKLAYAKKVRETFVEKFLAYHEAEETYYPAELAKVKELTAEYLAKVNEVKEIKNVGKYDVTYFGASIATFLTPKATLTSGSIYNVKKATAIDNLAAVTNLKSVAHQYADIVNGPITRTDNKYFTNNGAYNKLDREVEKMVGNSEARTTKDIAALSDKAIALVKELPTVAAVNASKDAADDAVEALPSKITTADKATIDAAKAAVEAYEDLSEEEYFAENEPDLVKAAVIQYVYAFNNEMATKVKAVSETDKAAINALIAEIEAVEDEYEDELVNLDIFGTNTGKLEGYLDKIQDTEAAAVRKAIAAIPVGSNITEADKATVENARKLYDAYVAEYTNYKDYDYNYTLTVPTDGFVADDFDYQTLVNAETLLGLNQESPAKAVESLKITASSTAKKGSITVKWTVKGEADIDGYEIWKSTKQSSGYKKAFTTTKKTYKNTKGLKKGTRYYYKVRAYKVIDGVKVTSDWSNKAYRKAK